jgi:hypothetical protein
MLLGVPHEGTTPMVQGLELMGNSEIVLGDQ